MGRGDKFHDDYWPIGFDKSGEPNVVGFIADAVGFMKKLREDARRRYSHDLAQGEACEGAVDDWKTSTKQEIEGRLIPKEVLNTPYRPGDWPPCREQRVQRDVGQ